MADDIASLGLAFDISPIRAGIDDLRMFETIAKQTGDTVDQVQRRFKALARSRSISNHLESLKLRAEIAGLRYENGKLQAQIDQQD